MKQSTKELLEGLTWVFGGIALGTVVFVWLIFFLKSLIGGA